MSNPYSTNHLWSPETLAAYCDMPKDHEGKNLGFVEANREAWKEWMRRTPKHLWHPVCIEEYKKLDFLKGKR
jgi:hypothetical protein